MLPLWIYACFKLFHFKFDTLPLIIQCEIRALPFSQKREILLDNFWTPRFHKANVLLSNWQKHQNIFKAVLETQIYTYEIRSILQIQKTFLLTFLEVIYTQFTLCFYCFRENSRHCGATMGRRSFVLHLNAFPVDSFRKYDLWSLIYFFWKK